MYPLLPNALQLNAQLMISGKKGMKTSNGPEHFVNIIPQV